MKLNARTLITKGLLGIKNAIALITKGLLDELVIKKAGIGKVQSIFNKYFHVQGKVSRKQVYSYKIVGIKLKELSKKYKVNATKLISLIFNPLIKATVKNSFTVVANTIGKSRQELEGSLGIKGIKSEKRNEEIILKGIQKTIFSQENTIKAISQSMIVNENKIKGIKQITSKEEIKISGKKDITNILTALDLI